MPITAAVVTDPTRVSVSLTAWPVDGALTVTRVHPDGSRWPVRGADGLSSVVVSGGVGAVLDDEAPYMAQVIYEAVSSVSPNLVVNGSFESGTTGWTPISATVSTADTPSPRHGAAVGVMTCSGASTPRIVQYVPVSPGQVYAATADLYTAASGISGHVLVTWRNVSGTQIGFMQSSAGQALAPGSWATMAVSGAAPAGAASAGVWVRAIGTPAAGTVVAVDAIAFEAGTSVAYSEGPRTLVSNPVTVDIDTAFVTVPGLPGLRMPLTLVAKPGASRERPATVITPRGRRNRVVISDALKGRLFQVRVRSKTFAEADLLEDLAESGATLLLRMPGTRWPWVYATVTKLEAEPVVHYRPAADASPTDVSAWEEWVLSCEESDPPVGGITGDPTGSWDAITAAGLTWDQLTAAGVTWAALGLGAY